MLRRRQVEERLSPNSSATLSLNAGLSCSKNRHFRGQKLISLVESPRPGQGIRKKQHTLHKLLPGPSLLGHAGGSGLFGEAVVPLDGVVLPVAAAVRPVLHNVQVQGHVRDEQVGVGRVARAGGLLLEEQALLAALVDPQLLVVVVEDVVGGDEVLAAGGQVGLAARVGGGGRVLFGRLGDAVQARVAHSWLHACLWLVCSVGMAQKLSACGF